MHRVKRNIHFRFYSKKKKGFKGKVFLTVPLTNKRIGWFVALNIGC